MTANTEKYLIILGLLIFAPVLWALVKYLGRKLGLYLLALLYVILYARK